jgi:hypothetical protein
LALSKQLPATARNLFGRIASAFQKPKIKGKAVDERRELEALGALLEPLGIGLQPRPRTQTQAPPPRPPSDTEPTTGFPEEQPDDLEMVRVQSSNVHSIGWVADRPGARSGTLYVRFLAQEGSRRAGPGALYEYRGVPVNVFTSFEDASSKGEFVWDNIRVRGTVSGHRYAYELVGIGGRGYIPRQAALRRGESGEYFLPRGFQGRRSALPERKVHERGPNPQRGPGPRNLALKRGRKRP